MLLTTIASETTKHILPGTAISVALGSQPLQAALVNFAVAALVRLTSHIINKRRTRRTARKAVVK